MVIAQGTAQSQLEKLQVPGDIAVSVLSRQINNPDMHTDLQLAHKIGSVNCARIEELIQSIPDARERLEAILQG